MMSPIARRYGVEYCTICNLALAYCTCAVTTAAPVSTVATRGGCRYCGRTLKECRCGTTPARDACMEGT